MMRRHPALGVSALALMLGLAACGQPAQQAAPAVHHAAVQSPAVNDAAARALVPPDYTLQTIDLPASGSRTVQGALRGDRGTAYAVAVAAGQTLRVTLESRSTNVYMTIFNAATGGEAVFNSENAGRNASIRAASATTYVIVPNTPRAIARRGGTLPYALTIARQ